MVQLGQTWFDPADVEVMRSRRIDTEALPHDLAGEGEGLKINESGGPLDVCQVDVSGLLEPVELGTHSRAPAQFTKQGLGMALQDAIQVDQVAADVVDDLDGWPHRATQENAAHADKWFAVGDMIRLRKNRAYPFGQPAFSAQPGGGRLDGLDRNENKMRTFH